MTENDKRLLNLLSLGLDSDLAAKIIKGGYTLTKLKSSNKCDLADRFPPEELEIIWDAVKRKPIPKKIIQRLVDECGWKCCACWYFRQETAIIVHHIEEHSKTGDDSYENLVLLCPNHHAMAHSNWEISQNPLPPAYLRTCKSEWIQAISGFKAGLRPAPGDEPHIQAAKPNDFIEKHNYVDQDAQDFGRHDLSNRMVELFRKDTATMDLEEEPARTWIAFLSYPTYGSCQIDTRALRAQLNLEQRIGRGSAWYQGIPRYLTGMLMSPHATPRQFLATRQGSDRSNAHGITSFFRVRHSGEIEWACTYPLVLRNLAFREQELTSVRFTGLIGHLWQFLFLTKAIYHEAASFHGEIAVLLTLIGTNKTILDDFAEGWWPPSDPMYPFRGHIDHVICTDLNIQIRRRLVLAGVTDVEIEKTVRDIADELGAYYNQDTPQCFDPRNKGFPDRKYLEKYVWG